jgi:hypothetical protein
MLSNRGTSLFVLIAIFALAIICQAQVQPQAATGIATTRVAVGGVIGGVVGNGPMFFGSGITGPAVTGKPFCADIETLRTQMLADGNRIQNTAYERICRDSQGRIRTESKPIIVSAPRVDVPAVTMISIVDPTNNVNYTLLADQHKAIKHQFKVSFPESAVRFSKPKVEPLPSRSTDKVKNELLGTEAINGLIAKGSRTTTVIPEGAVGNERPLTITFETWVSDDLRTALLIKQFDPRSGEMVREMKNITREEPDPSLFQIPADYTVEELPPPVRP